MKDSKFIATKKAGILGILGNIFLLIIKAIIGFTSTSQAMIADSINSAGDIFASLMTFIGNKIASVPNDEDHNFGHGKAEYIFSMFISISMILASAKLAYDSFCTLIKGSEIVFSWFLVIVCIVTIITKVSLYLYTKFYQKRYNSILLKANMKDHRNDCFVTTFTLISVLLSLKGIYWFDSIVGIGISLWICYTGITILIESYNVLMDISLDKKTNEQIKDIISNHKEVKHIISVASVPTGSKHIVFITFSVDGNMTTFDSHNLANTIEEEICKIDGIYNAIAHVEPV